jgi:DNA mismatch endonuclease (patch repair protein)
MADIFNKIVRSQIMREVKSRYNKSTEIKLVQYFQKNRITGWRRNFNLIGKPDFVFPKMRIVIFADGCFWHGHNCRNLRPQNNKDYWTQKINRNKERDREVTKQLTNKNWSVIRIWECELKDNKTIEKKLIPLLKKMPSRLPL